MPKIPLKPYWQTTDGRTVKLYRGDVIEVLRGLPGKSVHCIVTSPPYWGLRDYGTGTWEGGDTGCNHSEPLEPKQYRDRHGKLGRNNTNWDNRHGDKRVCPKCGAKRTDYQLGSEKRHDCLGWARGTNCAEEDWANGCHVCRMVLVFRELRKVLRDDGVCFLNYGDSYSGGATTGLKSGNLCGVPWRVALALQADGWVLRQDIIWHKPSTMPESVTNRCTKAHEYLFLLTKRMGYFYDAEAVKEPFADKRQGNPGKYKWKYGEGTGKGKGETSLLKEDGLVHGWNTNGQATGSNKRSVWTIPPFGYSGAHFATFPPKLVEPCVLAGTSEEGCCPTCGSPWERVVEKIAYTPEVVPVGVRNVDNSRGDKTRKLSGEEYNEQAKSTTAGWRPTCPCYPRTSEWQPIPPQRRGESKSGYDHRIAPIVGLRYKLLALWRPMKNTIPCTVLDPFCGSGTTCCVAAVHGRYSIGIDLSEEYLREQAVPRIEGELFSRPALQHLIPREKVTVRGMGKRLI